MRAQHVPHPGVTTDWKSVCLHDACTWCLHSDGIYCYILQSLHTSPQLLYTVKFAHIDSPYKLYDTASSTTFRTLTRLRSRLNIYEMRFLWCFRPKAIDQRTGDKRNDRTYQSQQPCPNSGPTSLPLQRAGTSQPLPHPPPRTPPQRPQQSLSETSLSSGSSPSIVRATSLEDPFITTRFPPVLRHTTNSDHNPPSARAWVPDNLSTSRKHNPTLLENRTPTELTFNKRLARLSTQAPSTDDAVSRQHTFLDDKSSTSSHNYEPRRPHGLDDSGYISTFTTPAKADDRENSSAASSSILPDAMPTPPCFNRPLTVPSVQVDTPQTPESPRDVRLCEYRGCLRHKQTCLEHTPTPAPRTQTSRIPAPTAHDKRQGRRARGDESRRHEPDVWIQIASEYQPGL